jgi:hypothetical protein
MIGDVNFPFDAKIGSITDFQSASDQAELALVATPFIKKVGVPTTPKYYQIKFL